MCKVNQPTEKWVQDYHRYFTEKTHTAYKYIKRCSISLATRYKITGNNPNILNSRKDKYIGLYTEEDNIE